MANAHMYILKTAWNPTNSADLGNGLVAPASIPAQPIMIVDTVNTNIKKNGIGSRLALGKAKDTSATIHKRYIAINAMNKPL